MKKTKLYRSVRFRKPKKSVTIPVLAIGTRYEVVGTEIESALDALGVSQAAFARACGLKSSSWICKLVNAEKTEISSCSVDKLVTGMKKIGGDISGVVEFVK